MSRSMEIIDPETSASAGAPTKESSAVALHYPVLTRSNYATWAIKMKVFMKAQGVWDAIELGDVDTRKDQMALAAIYQGIPEDMLFLLAEKETAKAAWEALKTMPMGAERVREAKVQTLKSEFEVLRMTESESIDDFAIRLTTIVNKIRGLGAKFLPVVSLIEQFGDLKTMTIEEWWASHAISAGDQHLLLIRSEWKARSKKSYTFAVTDDGTVHSYGSCTNFCLGHGDQHDELLPRAIQSFKGRDIHVVCVSAGDEHAVALDALGYVYTWGRGYCGALGHGDENDKTGLELISSLKGQVAVQVCARKRKTFVLTTEGSVLAFGWMGFGILGFPSDKVMRPRGLDSLCGHYVSQISTGLYHTVAVTNRGIVFGFGDNKRAQLGQEYIRGFLKPTEIMFQKGMEDTAIAAPSS